VTDQATLDFPGWVTPAPAATIADRFAAFHAANPWVADHLERLAVDDLTNGAQRIGVKHYVEVLRWQHRRATTGAPFKFDNSLTSHYARLLIQRRPELAAVIETRQVRAP
jgi:hypothetical protein